jgi:PleD family two-component response regulator
MKRHCELTRCLVVDDSTEWRGRAQGYLASHGFDIIQAETEDAAFAQCVSDMPDVVLVGTRRATDFIRQLRRHSAGSDAVVIMCPDAGDVSAVGDAIWHGATDYLVKTCNREIFDAKLRQTGIL